MSQKLLPFTKEQVIQLASRFPTPFYLYDQRAMEDNARDFNAAFSWNPGFREYFAVKATPNQHIMKVLAGQGFGMDCSSLAELVLCEKIGLKGEAIMFTSNETPLHEYQKALELGAIINLDDITHLEFLQQDVGLPELLCFRFNPGDERTGNEIIGKPAEAKFGLTRQQIFEAYRLARDQGVARFGLHAMVASNELNPVYFVDTARMLFSLIGELSRELGIRFEFVNLGGGIGIPYRPGQLAVDFKVLSEGIRAEYSERIAGAGLAPLKVFFECGRMITGPYGYLITKAIHRKEIYKNYIGVDACMANLMRPGMYGSYHHITVLGKETASLDCTYDVVGSLCENNDKFAVDRLLPKIDIGDILVIHDAGAHGHAMGFNYNGKLRCAEVLWQGGAEARLIRRAETVEDYLRTQEI